jgi:RNA polymerase-associated protein CTR9
MHLHQKDISKACQCFEAVLEKHPSNYETLKVLGSIYTKQHKKEQALEKLYQVVKSNPDDAEAWIEIAQLLEISKPKQALEAYEKALANIEHPPAELWNNIAILRHKTGDQEAAEQAYSKITEKKKTLIYNKARWHEDNGRLELAEELYNEVLNEQARYTDALLRLAIIYKKRNDYSKALEFTRKAISIEKKPINALCQKGCLEAELGETKKALETFHKVINEHSHNDIYALLALGNLHYEMAMTSREGAEKNFQKAIQYFLKVVDMDEFNCFAAVGVAMVLGETGDLKQALDIFKQVFDIQPSLDFLLVNRAIILMVQGRYEESLKFYKKSWEKGSLDKEIIGTYMSFTYFLSGKFSECVETLRKVNKSATNQLNIGLVLHEHAVFLLKKENRDPEDTRLAIIKIEEALKAYEQVINTKWEPRVGIESRQEDKRKIEWSMKKAYDKIDNAKRLQEDTSIYLEKDLEKRRGESTRMKDYLRKVREDFDEGPEKHQKVDEENSE